MVTINFLKIDYRGRHADKGAFIHYFKQENYLIVQSSVYANELANQIVFPIEIAAKYTLVRKPLTVMFIYGKLTVT